MTARGKPGGAPSGSAGTSARIIVALTAAYAAANLSWFTQPFQFTVLASQAHFGAIASGWILSSEIGTAALVSMALGYYGIGSGGRRGLALGTAVCVIASIATLGVASFAAILACRMLAGVGEGSLIAGVNRAVARLDDPERRYGHINALMNLIGFLVIFGMPLALAPLQMARAVFAVLAAATLLCLAATLLHPGTRDAGASRATVVSGAPRGIGSGRGIGAPRGIGGGRGVAVFAAVLLSSAGVSSFYPVTEVLGQAAGISETALDSALSMAYVGATIGSAAGAWIDARLGRLGGALWVGVGLSCAIGLLEHAHTGIVFGVGMFLFGLFWFHGLVTCLGLAALIDRSGSCAAACGGAFLLGGGIGPVLGGYELDWSGGESGIFTWTVAALMTLFVLAVWLANRPRGAARAADA